MGGAYRWDDSAQRWIPLTDGMGDVDFTGIESLAVDPSDPNRVYLAAGIYSRGKAAILRSADQGRTWQRTDVPFKMGGNEAGRFNGERLAVDPNDGAILFFGSRRDGLWKSADRGATWQKVETFPDRRLAQSRRSDTTDSRPWFGFNQQPVGIVCVLFDPASGRPGQPTPVIVCGRFHNGNQSLSQHQRRGHLAGGGEPARGLAPESPRSGRRTECSISATARSPVRIP